MTNLKTELLKSILVNHNYSDIIAFNIKLLEGYEEDTVFHVVGETFNEDTIPDNLEYDSGYGIQHLFGCVLFSDGSWLSREEYDGSEWWEYNIAPTIKQVLDGGY